ncbi:F0F1 ATP synthase subunit B [Thermosipho ferrireducens]|uniref:ATP synthase subunit b n=1 Tax=Thermosipho ferrireducens TaxID=2571116 RepID=A0ABX7S7D4_9BACT|nr:F0F1 ATP synthase subunit B [Thermosipho ferrireducens]QTA37173.1 F0F1 ATP synthase subunit B [Thermosipho ferrireducens]
MDMFEINLTSVIQLMSFLLLLYILKVFLYDKYFETLDARKKKIEDEINAAEKLRKDAEKIKEEATKELHEIREKAEEIIKKAKEEAKKIIEDAKTKADDEADKILISAREQIERERIEMIKEVEEKAGELAIALAFKILKGTLDEKAKREYLLKILKGYKK